MPLADHFPTFRKLFSPKGRRWITRSFLGLLLVLLAALGAARANALIARHHAQQLLEGIITLCGRSTTFEQAMRVVSRFPGWVEYSENCNREECEASSVVLHAWPSTVGDADSTSYRVLNDLGLRPWFAVAYVQIRAGRVRSLGFGLDIGMGRNSLAPSASMSPRLWRFHGAPRAYLDEHPNYLPSQPAKKRYFSIDITPDATDEEIRRAFDFKLSCLTQFQACREHQEIMPSAWADFETLKTMRRSPNLHTVPCTERTHRRLARDSDVVSLVEIKAVHTVEILDSERASQVVEYSLLRDFREPPVHLRSRIDHLVYRGSPIADPNGRGLRKDWFQPGNHLILFGWGNVFPGLSDEDCGAALATPDLVARVQDTIAKTD